MKNKRKAFLDSLQKDLNAIDSGNTSIPIILKSIEEMSDKEFKNYIDALRNGVSETPDYDMPREIVSLVIPHMTKTKINVPANLKLAKMWGHDFFEPVWLTDSQTGTPYLTRIPYGCFELPIIRQAQTLEKGISTTGDNNRLDSRTHQVAEGGGNKGASLSAPETQILVSQGRIATATELLKFRGGDISAYSAMTNALIEAGQYNQSDYTFPTVAKSTTVASIYYKARHINNDIDSGSKR